MTTWSNLKLIGIILLLIGQSGSVMEYLFSKPVPVSLPTMAEPVPTHLSRFSVPDAQATFAGPCA